MKRTTIQDAMFPGCPVRNILARLCDKWTLLVIYILDRSGKDSMRFTELKQKMPDISQRMLSMTLRTLEEDGYVTRTIFSEIPPRVEYALTERAKSLKPILDSLLQWSVDNMDDIMSDRKKTASINDRSFYFNNNIKNESSTNQEIHKGNQGFRK